MAASPRDETTQELRPAESGCSALAAVCLDKRFVVGAVMTPFVFPALQRRGRPGMDSGLWLDVRTEHGLELPGDVFGDGRDRRLAVRAWRELFLEALERM